MIITHDDLPKIREQYKDKKIAFCSGAFDLTHAGHILFFEDCKKHGDVLVVCLGTDALTANVKGSGRPVLNQHIRLKTVASLKPVDYCYVDSAPLDQPPLTLLDMTFARLRPDVYVINEDASDIPYRREVSRRFGVELVILPRWCPPEFEDISTTKIIEKIKRLP